MKNRRIAAICALVASLAGCTAGGFGPVEESSVVISSNENASATIAPISQYQPSAFAAFGLLIFPRDPNSDAASRERFHRFCAEFIREDYHPLDLEKFGVPFKEQMVTILPVRTSTVGSETGPSLSEREQCEIALKDYDLRGARIALGDANAAVSRSDGVSALSGRGPFFVAWAPGEIFGELETRVLVLDMTNSTSDEQIAIDVGLWFDEIQKKPAVWRDGWNLEGFRQGGARWLDRHALELLKIYAKVTS